MPRSSMARRMFASSRRSNCLRLAPLSTISPSLSSTQGSPSLGMACAADSAGAAREVPDILLVCQCRSVAAPFDSKQEPAPGAGLERWCTVKYMFLLYANKSLDELGPEEARQLFDAWKSANTQMADAGV